MTTKRAKKRAPSAAKLKMPLRRALQYKVIELSTVDEASLERTINEWSPYGWSFDGVQFAMRESSKRPSMAFVFFTKQGGTLVESVSSSEAPRGQTEATAHLRRLAHPQSKDAWSRLQALANEDEASDI